MGDMETHFDAWMKFPATSEYDLGTLDRLYKLLGSVEDIEQSFAIEFSCGDGKYLSDLNTKEEIEMYNDEITEITLWNLYAEEEYKITKALDCDCANQPIQPASLPVDTKPSTPSSPTTSEPQSTPSNPTYGGNDNDDDASFPILNFIFRDKGEKSQPKSKSSKPKPKKEKMPDIKGPVIRH